MAKVLNYNIYNLQFSIEGASAAIHDRRVGCKGAWEKIIQAIRNAQDFGVRYITNSTATNLSMNEMYAIIDLLDSLGVKKMNIGNTLPECSGRNFSILMDYRDVVDIAEKLTLYAMTKKISFSFITPLPFCLKENKIISNPSVCSAGQYSVVIDINGELRPCSVCNPLDVSFPKIESLDSYNSVYSKLKPTIENYLNKEVPPECKSCSRLSECKAACPLYWKIPGIATPSQWKQNIL